MLFRPEIEKLDRSARQPFRLAGFQPDQYFSGLSRPRETNRPKQAQWLWAPPESVGPELPISYWHAAPQRQRERAISCTSVSHYPSIKRFWRDRRCGRPL